MTYLYWFLPGIALQFALVSMGSALRGTGIVKPTMVVQMVTVLLNVVLAPVLIAGWGTGHPMGVAGAGLASTISVACGVVVLCLYFRRLEKYVAVHADQLRPRFDDLAPAARHRAAVRRRVPADVRDHGGHLRHDPRTSARTPRQVSASARG